MFIKIYNKPIGFKIKFSFSRYVKNRVVLLRVHLINPSGQLLKDDSDLSFRVRLYG